MAGRTMNDDIRSLEAVDFTKLLGDATSSSAFSGEGVEIGIISSSFGAPSNTQLNMLPKDVYGVDILKDVPNDSLYATGEGAALAQVVAYATGEGAALAQVVASVAPEAELLFHTGVGSNGDSLSDLDEISYGAAIESLSKAGADIIFDDIANLSSPLFKDGLAAKAIEEAVSEGIVYLTAAGNNGAITYEDEYRPSEVFQVGSRAFVAHDFDPSESEDIYQDIRVSEKGAILKPILAWNSPASSADDELILFLLDSPELPTEENTLGVSLVSLGAGKNEAISTLSYIAAPDQKLYYVIAQELNEVDSSIDNIKWVSGSNGSDRSVKYEYVDPLLGYSTVFGQANAENAITVGSASDDGTAYDSFASRGGVPILFDEQGNRLPEPIVRSKPDVIGPDNLTTAFPEDSMFNPFIGTSAAVAYVAGVVALMEEAAGGPDVLQPETIKAILGATDKPVEPAPGLPPSAGFVQPEAAVLGANVVGQIAQAFPNLPV